MVEHVAWVHVLLAARDDLCEELLQVQQHLDRVVLALERLGLQLAGRLELLEVFELHDFEDERGHAEERLQQRVEVAGVPDVLQTHRLARPARPLLH